MKKIGVLGGGILSLFISQSASAACMLNGKEVPCDEIMGGGFALAMLILPLIFIIIGIFCLVFWIMMLVDAIKHEDKDKMIWVLVLIFTGIIGAVVYYFVKKRKRKNLSTTPSQPPVK